MTKDELRRQIEGTAKYCRMQGQYVTINRSMPWVEVYHGLDGWGEASEYFFQGDDALNLLAEVPEYVSSEDYILWLSQGW
jgi:hypothetical protein